MKQGNQTKEWNRGIKQRNETEMKQRNETGESNKGMEQGNKTEE